MSGIPPQEDLPSQHISDVRDESTSSKPFRFLDLPLELRNEIYTHLFVQPEPISCFRTWFTTAPRHLRRLAKEKAPDCCGKNYACTHYDVRLRPRTSLLRVCRQVSEEALDVLYGRNAFRVDLESTARFLKFFTVGERNLRRVRDLMLCAFTEFYSYCIARPGELQWEFFRPAAKEARFWKALLQGLRSLLFVMKIPIWGHHGAWPVWVGQLEGVLGFVGENVDEATVVTVDDNYSMFLCEAVDRCFKKGLKRVRSLEGDRYYYKTRFDPENITEPLTSN
ncbi:uncharacterized protein GGS22DRAFT_70429 [Annulohypoxylon maeteangense]|uniref:uncharacterized protein n=1 Tax=Annulohypoxylon maeteangense TaxID=1927788 RepID=UPI0020086DED|nr:uncharacterized protein GGS22DRAFT_70429 [Annulohypoxylon maeteangense]KAI0889371.1 hypothetical protein GGS22DRAFT_70429 [Annulohypoxylon maeteangense]